MGTNTFSLDNAVSGEEINLPCSFVADLPSHRWTYLKTKIGKEKNAPLKNKNQY